MTKLRYTVDYFGSHSQEAMKVVLHMILQRERGKGLFTTEDLGKAISLEGRSISGVLSSFSKRGAKPLAIKAGVRDTNWNGKRFSRPKQLWMLNPELSDGELAEIKASLLELLALEMWCPWCGYVSREDWRGFRPTLKEPRPTCPDCGGPGVREIRDNIVEETYGAKS